LTFVLPQDYVKAEAVFKEFDSDGSGSFTQPGSHTSILANLLTRQGQIDPPELQSAMLSFEVRLSADELATVFNALDRDGSGSVTLPEMRATLKEWKEIRVAKQARNRAPQYGNRGSLEALRASYQVHSSSPEQPEYRFCIM